MAQLTTETERVVAILHDTVENGGDRVSFDRLRADGYPPEVVEAIDLLTRRDGEPYEDFVERIAPNALARRVKLADLEDNLDYLRRSGQTADAGYAMRLAAQQKLRAIPA